MHAVIGQFCGPYYTVQLSKIMSIILIVDKNRALLIVVNTNQSKNIGSLSHNLL